LYGTIPALLLLLLWESMVVVVVAGAGGGPVDAATSMAHTDPDWQNDHCRPHGHGGCGGCGGWYSSSLMLLRLPRLTGNEEDDDSHCHAMTMALGWVVNEMVWTMGDHCHHGVFVTT
jgi:hypothetical protein